MKKITPQAVFDAAWQAFVVGNRKPAQEMDKAGFWSCEYITKTGRRCPFGLLMTASECRENNGTDASGIRAESVRFVGDNLAALQFDLHDRMCHRGDWAPCYDTKAKRAAHYRTVAAEFGLRVPGD